MATKEKLQSVQNGFEYDLSEGQILFLNDSMKLGEGKYYPCVHGKRYGYLAFEMPKNGYYSFISDSVFKNLQGIARKSHTTLYISNCLPDDIRESHKPIIMFVAQSF